MTTPEAASLLRELSDYVDDELDAARLLDIAIALEDDQIKTAQTNVLNLPTSVQADIPEELWDWLMDDKEQPNG